MIEHGWMDGWTFYTGLAGFTEVQAQSASSISARNICLPYMFALYDTHFSYVMGFGCVSHDFAA